MDEVQSRTLECDLIDLYARIDVLLIDGTIKMNVKHRHPLTIFCRRVDGGKGSVLVYIAESLMPLGRRYRHSGH